VDVEVDLSLQKQLLDSVILRRGVAVTAQPVWPDGFGEPAAYNLMTFKALLDPLNAFALKELAAHGVYYRKKVSPNLDALLPEEHFRLIAASMQLPRQLAGQVVLQERSPGAYDVLWGTDTIRVRVLRELPEAEQNVVWNLFSGDKERIATAFQRLQPRLHTWSSLVNQLLSFYGLEGMPMPYTMEDLEREVRQRVLSELTLEQRLEGLSLEQRLQGYSLEEIERYLKRHNPSHKEQPPEPPEQQTE
jgi:hypothetical protein